MGMLLALLAVEAVPDAAPLVAPTISLTGWLLSLIPPDALAWILAHPGWTALGIYAFSAVLSSVPTTYVLEVPKIGLRVPVGYIVHFCIGNVFQVLRKVSPGFAALVDKVLPGKQEPPADPPAPGGAP